jgi:steroid delta-isomerase-like uncharacterized protein
LLATVEKNFTKSGIVVGITSSRPNHITQQSDVSLSSEHCFCYPSAHGGHPMSEANKQLVWRWFEEVWNKQREEAIDEMFAPAGKAYGFPQPDSVLIGPENFKTIHRNFLGAFPDVQITRRDIICEGDRAAITWTATMTHLGDALGFPPSLQRVSLEGCSVLVVRDGQIHEGRNYMELQGLIQRLKESSSTTVEETQPSVA